MSKIRKANRGIIAVMDLDSEIFDLEIVEWQGAKAVKKTAKPEAPQARVERLQNDVYGMQFFSELVSKHLEVELYIPKVFEASEKSYTREYLPGPPLVTEQMDLTEAKPLLDKLAQVLAEIDKIEPYGEVKFVGSSDYRNILSSVNKWSAQQIAEGINTKERVDAAVQKIVELSKYLQPRIAHGDMSPHKHVYLKDGKIAFIDFENFTPNAARYYDVAWAYVRLYAVAKTPDIAEYFLNSFIEKSAEAEHKEEQLLAVLTQRILGLQYDASVDYRRGLEYRSRAVKLMDICLEGKLEELYL